MEERSSFREICCELVISLLFFSAATFFCCYELTKNLAKPRVSSSMYPVVHMFAATVGEVVGLHEGQGY